MKNLPQTRTAAEKSAIAPSPQKGGEGLSDSSCSGGTFVLQVTDEETGEWKDYLKYDPSSIGPCFPHEDSRRIVYYPNVPPEKVAGHVFRMKETLTALNGGPPIVSQNEPSLEDRWQASKNDEEKWRLVIDNASQTSMILDNDSTHVSFDDGDTWFEFSGYIGWNSCAISLCKALGLKYCTTV